MPESANSAAQSDWLHPSGLKLALAATVALVGFLLPQEVPLEWYPLNHPGTDINYLEIACAANVNGEVHIDYDVASYGHRSFDSIRWPISPTTQTYTYTFPLPDAPITELHVSPPKGGSLTIRQLRVINRRGEEIRRFPRDLFRIERGITAIMPLSDAMKLVAAPGATDPSTRIELFARIVPEGMNRRNLLRCLLSTGYLAGMLTILLLAVLFIFYRPPGWRDALRHIAFLALIAFSFSLVGNRGLIRNSIRYASDVPPFAQPGLKLEIDVAATFRSPAQLFWDTGQGMSEAASARAPYEPHDGLQTIRFSLPPGPVKSFRLDPGDGAGEWSVRGIRVVDHGQRTRAVLPLDSLLVYREIARLEVENDHLHLVTTPGAGDPITNLKSEAVEAINHQLAAPARR